MGMATVSGLVSGIWRAGSSATSIPLHQFCFCKYTNVMAKAGMRCGLGSNITYTNMMEFPPHLNWLRKTELGTQVHTLSNRRYPRISRAALDYAGGGDIPQQAVHTRDMSSSKKKGQPRGSLWRTRSVISKETVQAVHDLKRNKDNPVELAKVFQARIPRLLKMDLLATLSELQRQSEIDLALQIFDIVRKEIWYKPDLYLYREMMDALGRNRRIPELEKKFQELQDEGIKPEVPIYRELVGAYVRSHMLPEALAIHAKMVETCGDDHLSLQFIATGREKEAVRIKQRKKAAEKLMAEQGKEENSPTEAEIQS